MVQKKFFQRPAKSELLNADQTTRVYRQGGLVNLVGEREGPFIFYFSLIPGYFYRNATNSYEASKEYLKRGELIKIRHPKSLSECFYSKGTFYDFFVDSLKDSLRRVNRQDNQFLGYSFQPCWGDRTRREVFFSDLLDAAVSYLYFRETSQIETDFRYTSKDTLNSGIQIPVSVPSRREKQSRYRFKLVNVPFHYGANNFGISLTLRQSTLNTGEGLRPTKEIYSIQYKPREGTISPLAIRFLPQDIAAYFAIVEQQLKKGNNIPAVFSPFPFPSEELVRFYWRLKNKTLVFEPRREKSKTEKFCYEDYRYLYEAEISRAISLFLQRRENDLNKLLLRRMGDYPFLKDEIQKSLEGKSSEES